MKSKRMILQPSLDDIKQLLPSLSKTSPPPNLIPLSTSISADFLTPSLAYLKLSAQSDSRLAFLFESAGTTETIGRYSFVGANPRKVIKTGPGHGPATDPLVLLEEELSRYRVASVPGLDLPPLVGGAIGYVGYDCVKYFEPRTSRPLKDVVQVPESLFMIFDTIVAFDHFYQVIKVITYINIDINIDIDIGGDHHSSKNDAPTTTTVETAYDTARHQLQEIISVLTTPDIPLPFQPPIEPHQEYTSNIGQSGYEAHVVRLKEHIISGDIIQAVPSQRLSRPTTLHPFNIYRQLRMVNPSPYLFYIDCNSFQLVGASPELLVQSDASTPGRIITHPIAGTVRRGKTPLEDESLATELKNSLKDRAEHVMLVDLARNDINRVCDPLTTRVDRLMTVQKFSHVQHLVSQVSGNLREGMTRFDAFRSIFPAGTVSGAPKIKAMELIAELEGEKRGVYAGAVGYWGFDGIDESGRRKEGAMDTCIALRTMLVKDGTAYLQAGGGIVYDSDPYDEYIETMNKLGANMECIKAAEERYLQMEIPDDEVYEEQKKDNRRNKVVSSMT
ncbi:MAG: iso-1-cytochrome c [Watsoniomyces obsoletus]|nr:MAG: iso-1-cytochrome c [Watsoniomyces obsoletus]